MAAGVGAGDRVGGSVTSVSAAVGALVGDVPLSDGCGALRRALSPVLGCCFHGDVGPKSVAAMGASSHGDRQSLGPDPPGCEMVGISIRGRRQG